MSTVTLYFGLINYSAISPGDTFYIYNTTTGQRVDESTGGTSNFCVGVADSAGNALSGATVTLWYDNTLKSTGSTTGTFPYDACFYVPNYTQVNGTVSATGYQDGSYSYYKNYWDGWTDVTLYRTNETPPNSDYGGNLILTFRDVRTGELVNNVELDIFTDAGRTDLYDSDYTTSGVITTYLHLNTTYYFTASSGAYRDEDFMDIITTTPESDIIYLVPKTFTSFTPEIRIWAYSTLGNPVYNASVYVSSSTDSGSGYTSLDGHYTYDECEPIPEGESRTYTITVSRGGYLPQTATVEVSTISPTVTVYMSATTTGVTPGTTGATPTPTSVFTPAVTPQWSGQNTSNNNTVDGTKPGNINEMWLNWLITQAGVPYAATGLLTGLVITIICACFVGYVAGGIGAMIGGTFGWVASGVMGYIPAWAIIITIAVVAMVFFIFRSPGDG